MGDRPGSSLSVTPDELLRHSAHLRDIAGELGEIGRAAVTTQPGPEAYGRICAVVPRLLDQFREPLVEAIGVAATSVRDTADAVRGVAESYELSDEAASTAVRDTGGR
ncbi:type VII secretion target [Actinoplanes flavus]|uniref:ESX-1 secretion-associated protein n=1 Tax=Actinoplanes flavus TaxID=2820290 RepID=A0ABS3UDJ8_9ACTN|nr:type VII secretion target [Actinoplanes flavus]MBO3736851.1 ESX-1 secretion-associated protein [Actinoplanes flavus]